MREITARESHRAERQKYQRRYRPVDSRSLRVTGLLSRRVTARNAVGDHEIMPANDGRSEEAKGINKRRIKRHVRNERNERVRRTKARWGEALVKKDRVFNELLNRRRNARIRRYRRKLAQCYLERGR